MIKHGAVAVLALVVGCSDASSVAGATNDASSLQDTGSPPIVTPLDASAPGIVLSRAVNNGKSQVPSFGVSKDTGNGVDITFGDSAGIASPRLVVKYTKSSNTLAVVLTSLNASNDFDNYATDPVVVPGNQGARLCLLSAATASYPSCEGLGIMFSAAAGTVAFKATPMLAYPSGTATLTMTGTGTFKAF